jgi:hypothetical protein
MDKLILPESFEWSKRGWHEPLVSLVDVSRRFGVDRGRLAKRAAVLTKEAEEVKPEPGTSVLHVIAMGASEDYGPNKNADGYKRAMLERDHPTFVSDGRVYKEHDNDDVKKASGSVLASAYNDDMKRVELLMRVDDRKWSSELTKLANDGDVTVSMSCHVPYDVCAICGNKARRRSDYCRCMKKYAGRMLDDGRTVYVDNPIGRFFDISGVDNRADRIAFSLRKVAAALESGPVETGADLYALLRGAAPVIARSPRGWAKRAQLRKLADIEKEIEGVIKGEHGGPATVELSSAFSPDVRIEDRDAGALSVAAEKDLSGLLRSLGDARISLPLRDFVRIALNGRGGSDKTVSEAEDLLPGIFGRLLNDGDDDVFDDAAYDCGDCFGLSPTFSSLLSRVAPLLSIGDKPAKGRIMMVTIRGGRRPEFSKSAGALVPDPAAVVLAREYAKYKLALFDKCANDGCGASPLFYRLGVLQNYCRTLSEGYRNG